jgi:hypothetical protein
MANIHIHNTVPERALAMAVSGYGCDNSMLEGFGRRIMDGWR